ncbi:MAG: hypothetical protein ABH823_00995 [bacterium]
MPDESPLPTTTTTLSAGSTTTTTSASATTTTTIRVESGFTAYVTDLDNISSIIPTGSISDNLIKVRSHLTITSSISTVEVYAPMSAELDAIAYYVVRDDGVPDWALYFKVNDDFYYFFAHLIDVVPKIKAVAPGTPRDDSSSIQPTSPVSFVAGELIGSAEGSPFTKRFDFGAYDLTNTNAVANPERYYSDTPGNEPDKYLTGLNPYLCYPTEMKNAHVALFATAMGVLVTTTECRGVSQDVLGTASGYWYLDADTTAVYSSRLAIAEELNGSVRWGGVGSSGSNGQYDATVWYDYTPISPARITTDESHCYESSSGYLYVKLFSTEALGVYFGTGSTPESFPSSGYKTYVR